MRSEGVELDVIVITAIALKIPCRWIVSIIANYANNPVLGFRVFGTW